MSTKADILKAIREKCVIDCCCGSIKEVANCPIKDCALYPFRFGKDPTPSKKGFALKTPCICGDFSQKNTELIGKHGIEELEEKNHTKNVVELVGEGLYEKR